MTEPGVRGVPAGPGVRGVPAGPGVRGAPAEPVLQSRPGPLGRLLGKPVFWIVVVCLLGLVPIAQALARSLPDPPPRLIELSNFELTNEKGQPFGTEQLRGKVWVASFAFTSCPSVCPGLMEKMQELQHRTRNAGAGVHLVTFSVDPENDTPEKLSAYARRFKASPYRWSFVTGDYRGIETTVVGGFKLAMGKDAESFNQVFHSERFVLIDARSRQHDGGWIRGYYEATDEGIEKLAGDITLVLNLESWRD